MNTKQSAADAAHQRELAQCLSSAIALHQQGHLAQAETLYKALLKADPNHADALHLLGVMATQLGQYANAIALIELAIAQRPQVGEFHFNHAIALQNAARNDDAIDAYRRAQRRSPDDPRIVENLAVALTDAGDRDGAIVVCRRALELNPRSVIAHKNLGTLLNNAGDSDGARYHFEQVLAQCPALPDAHEKLATVLLRQHDFQQGFEEYEWRCANTAFLSVHPPVFAPYPTWTGDDLAARTLLITPEQGVGDEVLFASCYADVIERAAGVVIACEPRLQTLFARSFPTATVIGDAPPPSHLQIDCTISCASLPHLLRRQRTSFDGRPYLAAGTRRAARYRDALSGTGARLNIGISWRGGLDTRARNARSIELERWRDLLQRSDLRVVDLQYGDHTAEADAFTRAAGRAPVAIDGIDPLNDLDEFAALVAALDLVITVDNSTAHIAGALGVPTFVLLPAGAEWRWGDEHSDCPWYDSVRLFRQRIETPGSWDLPLAEVGKALDLAQPRPPLTSGKTPGRTGEQPRQDSGPGHGAVLLNDTRNWYHFGCTCTSLALHDLLRQRHGRVEGVPIHQTLALAGVPGSVAGFDDAQAFDRFAGAHAGLLAAMERSDAIYVNGEGTLHGASSAALSLLYLAHVGATRLGKPVRIVNHSCYPGGDAHSDVGALYRKVYAGADRVAVREPGSAAVMRALGIEVEETFDCLPLYVDRLYRPGKIDVTPYAVIAGGVTWNEHSAIGLVTLVQHLHARGIGVRVLVGARAFPAAEELRFADALLQASDGAATLLPVYNESAWLDAIAGARVLVSGRFHHTIAAAFVGTPFIAANSNTPKIGGLMRALEMDGLLAQPSDWSGNAAAAYARALCTRADAALDEPAAHRLQPHRRRELIERALGNVEEVKMQAPRSAAAADLCD